MPLVAFGYALLLPFAGGAAEKATSEQALIHFACVFQQVNPADPGSLSAPNFLDAKLLLKGGFVDPFSSSTVTSEIPSKDYVIDDKEGLFKGPVSGAYRTQKGILVKAGTVALTIYYGDVMRKALLLDTYYPNKPFTYFLEGDCKFFRSAKEWQQFESLGGPKQ